jgi:hypothetical protein
MRNVNGIFDHYRMSARSVWNTAFWPDPQFRDWDFVEDFRSIEKILFNALVLTRFDEAFPMDDIFHKPIPFFQVAPSTTSVPIMIACPRPGVPSGHWDDPVDRVGIEQVTMHFIAFFDWNQLDCRDLQYYRVEIAGFDEQPHLVGREALIERQYVNVFFTGE